MLDFLACEFSSIFCLNDTCAHRLSVVLFAYNFYYFLRGAKIQLCGLCDRR